MKSVSFTQVLDAAAYALVAERCRPTYIHDIRGGLQSLNSAIELLARSAKSPAQNGGLLEKAAALAQRAMATHEQAVIDIVKRMAPVDEPASTIDVGEAVHEALHLLRNDALAKSITFRSALETGVCISTQAHQCRLLILGLNVMALDVLAADSVIDVRVAASGPAALLEFKSGVPYPAILSPSDLWTGRSTLPPHELMLALTSQWVRANGGRIELDSTDLPSALRIYYPLAPVKATV